MTFIDALHKICLNHLIDFSGGTGKVEEWLADVKWKHYHQTPDVMVLVLEKNPDGKYSGAFYASDNPRRKTGEQLTLPLSDTPH
jgi:hypothetical protein